MAFINGFTGEATASSIGIQSNGAFVVGGTAYSGSQYLFSLARFNGGGAIIDPYATLLINNYSPLV